MIYSATSCNIRFDSKELKSTLIKDTSTFRNQIIKSITIPFKKADTLFLKTKYTNCGFLGLKDSSRNFSVGLKDENGLNLLSAKTGLKSLDIESLGAVLNGIADPESLKIFNANKIFASIYVSKDQNKNVINVFEEYSLQDTSISYLKEFWLDKNENWVYKTSASHKEIKKSGS